MNLLIGHALQTLPELRADLERVGSGILHYDIGDRPVYIVWAGELPTQDRHVPSCSGWTTDRLDVFCRDIIGDRWNGPGVAVVVDHLYLLKAASHGSPVAQCRAFLLGVADVFLHELAHAVLPVEDQAEHDRAAAAAETMRHRADNLAALLEGSMITLRAVVSKAIHRTGHPWEPSHGIDFIRASLHIAHRAGKLFDIPADLRGMGCAGPGYGLSSPERYLAALGDEPDHRIRESIKAICESEPPLEFSALFTADTERYLQSHPGAV